MAFPHPKPRKGNERKKDEPDRGDVVRNPFKRAVDIMIGMLKTM
jgi:hypothetical protein